MFRTVQTALMAGALVALAAGTGLADSGVVKDLENNARFWQDRGRDDKATEAWEKVLIADPTDPEALSALAYIKARAGLDAQARVYLERLKHAHPDDSRVAALQHRIDLGPRYSRIIAAARSLAQAGNAQGAIAKYREAFGNAEPPPALAIEYLETLGGTESGWSEAVAGLRRWVKRHPEDPRYRLALGKLLTYRESSRIEGISLLEKSAANTATRADALAAWKQALMWVPLAPGSEPLFAAYLKQSPNDTAVIQRRSLIKVQDSRSQDVQLGYQALKDADVKKADHLFRAAGSDPDALVGQAVVALKAQQFDKAKELLERVKVLAPDRPELWEHSLMSATFWSLMQQARDARARHQDDVAESRLLQAVDASSEESPYADLELANLYLSKKEYDKAETRLRQVLAAQPHQTDAMRDLVILLADTGRGADARSLNETLATLDPKKAFKPGWLAAEELRQRAAVSRGAGNADDARASLLAARDADPEDEWVLHDLANVDMELGRLNEAAGLVRKLLAAHPGMVAARVTEVRLLAQQGQKTAALEALTNLQPKDMTPDLEALKHQLEFEIELDSMLTKDRGKHALLRQELLIMEQRTNQEPQRMAALAMAWSDLGDYEHATSLMRDAIARTNTPTAGMRLQLASIFLKADDDENLEALLDQLDDDPSLSPQERKGLTNLRIAYAVRRADQLRSSGDLVLAFAQLKPILQEQPDQPKLLCALGRLFQAQDDYDDAQATFLRVLRNDPGNDEAREGAIDTALLAGNPSEAKRLIKDGLEREPKDARMHLLAGRFWIRMEDDAAAMAELDQAETLAENAAVDAAIRSKSRGDNLPVYIPERSRGPLNASSDSAALLQRASATFGETKSADAPAGITAAQQLQDEIRQEIERLRARHRLEVTSHIETRVRQGQDGLGALNELSLPIEASIPLAYTGRLTFGVTPIILDAGTLDLTNSSIAQTFGTSAVATSGTPMQETATGTALDLGYQYKTVTLDVGTTPLGFAVQNLTGGIRWRDQFGLLGVAAEVSRRSVTDSVLSYAGMRDPASGITWGGVVKEGGRLDLALLTAQTTYFIFGDYRYLTGLNVPDNQSVMGGAGVEWKLYDASEQSVVTGANVVGLGYSKNLSYFTLGNAGYFSPQAFAHIGIPFRWRRSGKLQVDVSAEPGLNWFREDPQSYYPLEPGLDAQRAAAVNPDGTPEASVYPGSTSVSFALNVHSKVTYPVTDFLKAGIDLSYHNAADYQEFQAALLLQFDFARKRSVADSPDAR